MMELAAADRVLFLNEANQVVRRVDLRFPEYDSHYLPLLPQSIIEEVANGWNWD